MNQTIRDLFSEEEWETLTEEYIPCLTRIAELPLIDKEEEHDTQ